MFQEKMRFAAVNSSTVKNLTNEMAELQVRNLTKFDRVAYRKLYDSKYFKKRAKCPNCGELKVRHMLKRHMQTKKCKVATEMRKKEKITKA